jgi:uncharacterized protein YlxW (UPF0749 family)
LRIKFFGKVGRKKKEQKTLEELKEDLKKLQQERKDIQEKLDKIANE